MKSGEEIAAMVSMPTSVPNNTPMWKRGDGKEDGEEVSVGGSPKSLEGKFDEVMLVKGEKDAVIQWEEGEGKWSKECSEGNVFR